MLVIITVRGKKTVRRQPDRDPRRAKWNEREFDFLANVNKPLWIFFIVLVWYAHDLFQSIVNSSPYNVIWANFLKDPCWSDPEFLISTSAAIRLV